MIIKYGKLKGKMTEKNITQKALAKYVGINQSSMNAKLNGHRDFTIKEACLISELLEIEDPKEYFFN